ncbi:hypothetical protein PG993_009038 [Apiospora rasikravindrae]|uniref:Heterokaryon incompatibility domain-containing protein n=1 Tax=Apiospora rasikravindrae TaxID=990691 RepID=A0ABR1SIA8_9PEZI
MSSDKSDGVAVLCDLCRPALRLPDLPPKEPKAEPASELGAGARPENKSGTTAAWRNTAGAFSVSDPDYSRTDEWPGLPNLHASIEATGCNFCRFLATALSSTEARQWLEETEVGPLKLGIRWLAQAQRVDDVEESVAGWLFQVLVWDNDWEYEVEPPFEEGLLVLSFPVSSRSVYAPVSEEVVKSRRFPRPVEASALERAPVEFLRTTLADCAEHSHPDANTTTPGFLPTRLIDVRGERPRIVELNKPSSEVEAAADRRYLALSYCWGGASQLQLTRESEPGLSTAGFSEETDLSPTQRDTVALARALSVPYVWIDALCIRQGDRADWEAEAATMGQVYSGAYLTVCAVSSASCQEGYLDRDSVAPVTIPADPVSDPSGAERGTYFFQPLMWSFRSEDAENTDEDETNSSSSGGNKNNNWGQFSLGRSHWSTRAWTFQEMMMSARKLYFTTSGMHFWVYWVVMGYGDRRTTNPTDAFPSLSGLAHTFAPLLRDEYVAGLWAQRLASGLLWECEEPSGTLESLLSCYNDPGATASYIGPSWTWVARGIVHQETSSFYLPNFVDECEALSAVCVPKGSDPCGELLSASLRVRALAALDHCSNHSHHNIETPEFTPARLVEALSERPRIVELNTPSNEPQPDRRYVALSYCWGDNPQQLLLTHDTEQTLKNGFSKDILSATQKDTIELAKALSIPYVWIDALCIRQGDHSDWESQAGVMGKIYSGAYLTICAASSSSCEEGYLQRDFVVPIEVPTDPVSDPSGAAGTYFFQPIGRSCNTRLHIQFDAPFSLMNSTWNTRAWTFQERMMSTRLLFFTTSGLYFNCGQYVHSEFYTPQGSPRHVPISSVRDTFELGQLLRTGDKSAVYDAWIEKVMNKYGDREMTKRTDAFPSLSGLAHTFASLLKDDYVAGLWGQDLARGLSWRLGKPAHSSLEALLSSHNSPDPYIGPSWSWVGRGELEFYRHYLDLVNVCQELSAECIPNGADECGELKSASLRIRTRVYPAKPIVNWMPGSGATETMLGRCRILIEFDFKHEHLTELKDCIYILIGYINKERHLTYGLIAHPADDGPGTVQHAARSTHACLSVEERRPLVVQREHRQAAAEQARTRDLAN